MKRYIPAILWAAFIMFICGVPGNSVPPVYIFTFDKLGHSVIFFVLYWFLLVPMRKDEKHFPVHHLLSALAAIFYAGLTELLQAYVFINRAGEWGDFLADALGVFAGVVVILLIQNAALYKKFVSLFPR